MADHIDSAVADLLDAINYLNDTAVSLKRADPMWFAVLRVYHAGQRVRRCGENRPDLSEPHISIERVRQPLTAILGHLDLALATAEKAIPDDCEDEYASSYVDVCHAHASALRLRDMCIAAERAFTNVKEDPHVRP